MAITSNVDLVNTYDGNFQVVSSRVLSPTDTPQREAAAQCLAIETVRQLLGSGMTVVEYNALDDPSWQSIVATAKTEAKLNVNVPVYSLNAAETEAAAGLGGNFFEHGYTTIMAGISQADKVTFTKLGGSAV